MREYCISSMSIPVVEVGIKALWPDLFFLTDLTELVAHPEGLDVVEGTKGVEEKINVFIARFSLKRHCSASGRLHHLFQCKPSRRITGVLVRLSGSLKSKMVQHQPLSMVFRMRDVL